VSPGTRRKAPAPSAGLQLQNSFSALKARGAGSSVQQSTELVEPEPHSSARRKGPVIKVGRLPTTADGGPHLLT